MVFILFLKQNKNEKILRYSNFDAFSSANENLFVEHMGATFRRSIQATRETLILTLKKGKTHFKEGQFTIDMN
jgi:hypothetical protein